MEKYNQAETVEVGSPRSFRRGIVRWSILALSALIALLLLASLGFSFHQEESLFSNIVVFSLVNLNVMALVVFIFMVGRNVVKLMFERRRGIFGARLRSRLVAAFVLIACVPMAVSFLVANGLLNSAMDGWFSNQVDTAVTGAVTIARQHLTGMKINLRGATQRVQRFIGTKIQSDLVTEDLSSSLDEIRQANDLYSIKLYEQDGNVVASAEHATAGVDAFLEPRVDLDTFKKIGGNEQLVRIEERGASQFIRSYSRMGRYVLVSSYRMDPEIVQAQLEVSDAFKEYEELKQFRHPLKTNFKLALALFSLVSLFGAIWVAFFVAKQITGPIQKLAEGTTRVARGNYDFQLTPARDDEMGFLVTSFNRMLQDLKSSRDEAERGNVLIQTILSNLVVGVIGLDQEKQVTSVNSAAGALLQIDHINFTPGVPLHQLLRGEDLSQVSPLLSSLDEGVSREAQGPGVAEVEIKVHTGGREIVIVCTAGRVVTHEGILLGYVILFDDVTDISRAQHLAAWRDVARRIAHEIKNPLTPIQLSAQRLDKLLSSSEHSDDVRELTKTIVEHVAMIKRLANEFSEYGRMPIAKFLSTDISTLLTNSVETLRVQFPEVEISLEINGKIPEMLLDPDQIRGAFINILDNAVAALSVMEGKINHIASKSILVRATFDKQKREALIEFCDSGVGISAKDKNRIFEPYYTTKQGGTGLGLAIVSSVISDHQGDIRVFDNHPRGTKFVVTLPQHPRPATLRRLTTS